MSKRSFEDSTRRVTTVRRRIGFSRSGQAVGQQMLAFHAAALVIGVLTVTAGQAVSSGASPVAGAMSNDDSTYSHSVTFRVIGMKKTKSGAT